MNEIFLLFQSFFFKFHFYQGKNDTNMQRITVTRRDFREEKEQ